MNRVMKFFYSVNGGEFLANSCSVTVTSQKGPLFGVNVKCSQ